MPARMPTALGDALRALAPRTFALTPHAARRHQVLRHGRALYLSIQPYGGGREEVTFFFQILPSLLMAWWEEEPLVAFLFPACKHMVDTPSQFCLAACKYTIWLFLVYLLQNRLVQPSFLHMEGGGWKRRTTGGSLNIALNYIIAKLAMLAVWREEEEERPHSLSSQASLGWCLWE